MDCRHIQFYIHDNRVSGEALISRPSADRGNPINNYAKHQEDGSTGTDSIDRPGSVNQWEIESVQGEMDLPVTLCPRSIDLEQLQALFRETAFWARDRSQEDWSIALTNSNPIVTVWDGDRLIGFARATSDGVFRATIWDVVIHSDYQGCGLGRKLVETVLMHPHVHRAERVYLMTTHQQAFYKRIGFTENQSTTLVLVNQSLEQELSSVTRLGRREMDGGKGR